MYSYLLISTRFLFSSYISLSIPQFFPNKIKVIGKVNGFGITDYLLASIIFEFRLAFAGSKDNFIFVYVLLVKCQKISVTKMNSTFDWAHVKVFHIFYVFLFWYYLYRFSIVGFEEKQRKYIAAQLLLGRKSFLYRLPPQSNCSSEWQFAYRRKAYFSFEIFIPLIDPF